MGAGGVRCYVKNVSMWLNGTVCLHSNAMWVNGIQLEPNGTDPGKFPEIFSVFPGTFPGGPEKSTKKFPGSFPNFSGNFPQCNTAYRKYVSLYSNSSIENVHCRIVQMTKSNRKLQCIAYTHFEMFLLFVCRANSCRACAVGKIEFAVRPKCCLKIMPLTKSRKLNIWTSYDIIWVCIYPWIYWIVYNIIDCDCR